MSRHPLHRPSSIARLTWVLAGVCAAGCQTPAPPPRPLEPAEQIHQGDAVLTVSEGKRLIARAVARMPVVERAIRDGMVIVCKGTTNTYVAEELLGRSIPRGDFVIGHITPAKGGRKLDRASAMPEVVLVKGKHRPDLSLDAALAQSAPGDVILKGGNALDYANRTAGVWTRSATGGTTGKIMPIVSAGKARLVIPIGLEKQIAEPVATVAARINQPVERTTELPRMRMLPGEIVTEIEALKILANVEAFQASAGGIGGAEGAVWLVWRGRREDVDKAREIVAGIQGEAPFISTGE